MKKRLSKKQKFKLIWQKLDIIDNLSENELEAFRKEVKLSKKEFGAYIEALVDVFSDDIDSISESDIDDKIEDKIEELTDKSNLEHKIFKQDMIILEQFHKKKILDKYDENLQELLGGMSPRNLDRKLKKFLSVLDNITIEKDVNKNIYKLVTPMDVFVESFDNANEIGWFLNMVHDGYPELFKGLEELTNKDKDIYLFKNTPFEDTNTIESNQNFKQIKKNIKARKYTKIKYIYSDIEYDNLKPIKLVFIDNNWYVAYVDTSNQLRFGRISFIERVDKGTKTGHFQPSSIEKHKEFLTKNLQNSMTLYGVEPKTAKLKASPYIAKYFKKDMKRFLSTQKFIKEEEDGSVIFSVDYTQELEILPFVQKWMPDLVILEPQELRDAYKKKLQKALNTY